MAVALILLVYALTAFDWGRRAGLLAAVVAATSLQQVVLARAAVTDMTLAALLVATLYGLRRWLAAEGKRPRLGWALVAGVALGLATLTKGPVALVLIGGTLVIHLALTRRLSRLVSSDFLAALAAALLVAAPWYLAMYRLHGEEFVQGFLVANNLTRFLKAEHAEQTGSWYSYFLNVPVLLVYFLPWSVFLPQALARTWRANEGARLLVTWAAVVFVFFSLSKTQLVTYIFPMFAVAAALVGVWWSELETRETSLRRGLRWGLGVAVVVGALLVPGLAAGERHLTSAGGAAGAVLGLILLLSWIVPLVVSLRRPAAAARALWALPAGIVVFTWWLVSAIMPLASPWVGLGPLVRDLPPGSPARVVSYNFHRESLSYYGETGSNTYESLSRFGPCWRDRPPSSLSAARRTRRRCWSPGARVYAREGRWELLANPAAASQGNHP